ncbi:MAG: GGDEF domain-containing protein [Oscillospiraceae bacterium]
MLLCFTIFLAKKNIIIDKYRTKFFIYAAITNVIVLILEMVDVYISTINGPHIYIMRGIINVIGFAICPLIPYFILCFNNYNKTRILKYCRILLCINILLSIVSIKTGWLFAIDIQNNYTRGPLFLFSFIINSVYIIVIIGKILTDNEARYYLEEKKFIISIGIAITLCTIFQIIFVGLLLIWSSVSVGLILYYIFLRELQFKYDVFTGVKNRQEFDKNIIKAVKCDSVGIVVMDLNDLKEINDLWGHTQGDQYIIQASKIIENSFKNIGTCYRIGGDEFCVICNNTTDKKVEGALQILEKLSSKVQQNYNFKISIAYGYAIFNKNENESIYEIFEHADQEMYLHKTKLKFSQNNT